MVLITADSKWRRLARRAFKNSLHVPKSRCGRQPCATRTVNALHQKRKHHALPRLQSAGLVDRVRAVVARTGIEMSQLEFEVTESGLMADLEGSARVLHELKGLGAKLAIDDFGTGYSSLTYLKRFPLDTLKIDRSFIKDLPHDTNDAALTSAIVAMGKSLQLELIAEGVETWEQANFLATLGCHAIQGFLFSKPVPAQDFAKFLVVGLAGRAATPAPRAAALA